MTVTGTQSDKESTGQRELALHFANFDQPGLLDIIPDRSLYIY
jgi:hypothetical protein